MSPSTRIQNCAWLLYFPVVIAIGLAVPGTTRQRFLHVLLTLALSISALGAMALIDAVRNKRPRGEIALAVGGIVFGFAGAFNILHELTNQFVPAMWIMPVLLIVLVVGIRLVYPGGAPLKDKPPK
jgi:hypothetical protein